MFDVLLGCLAFGLLYVFDFNKVKKIHSLFTGFFAIGVMLLAWSSYRVYASESYLVFQPTSFSFYLFMTLGIVSAGCMFYALFGALPFTKTYVEGNFNEVIDTGVYALCRHPGVWGFFFAYLFLFLATGKLLVLVACIIWTLMDIVHVWVQDVYFFPKTLKGYDQYKQTTPFLWVNRKSFLRFMQSFGK